MRPYVLVAQQRLQAEGGFPYDRSKVGWLLDKIADEKLTGGYGKRNTLCPECRVQTANDGSCFCR
jgi:hypothetical protein